MSEGARKWAHAFRLLDGLQSSNTYPQMSGKSKTPETRAVPVAAARRRQLSIAARCRLRGDTTM